MSKQLKQYEVIGDSFTLISVGRMGLLRQIEEDGQLPRIEFVWSRYILWCLAMFGVGVLVGLVIKAIGGS